MDLKSLPRYTARCRSVHSMPSMLTRTDTRVSAHPVHLGQWSLACLALTTGFVKDNLLTEVVWGGGWFQDDSRTLHLLLLHCVLYFYYYYLDFHKELQPSSLTGQFTEGFVLL